MSAHLFSISKPRAEQRAFLAEEEQAVALSRYFHAVRAIAGSFLVSEYPLVIIQDFNAGYLAADTAKFLVEELSEEDRVA